jgi:hypothetical protein
MSEPVDLEVSEEPPDDPVNDTYSQFPNAPPGDLVHYEGKWVAVRGGEVIASADDEATLRQDPAVQLTDLVYPIGEPPSGFYLINV